MFRSQEDLVYWPPYFSSRRAQMGEGGGGGGGGGEPGNEATFGFP